VAMVVRVANADALAGSRRLTDLTPVH
jgi:hypothetical protein